jgi:hypothetical protein
MTTSCRHSCEDLSQILCYLALAVPAGGAAGRAQYRGGRQGEGQAGEDGRHQGTHLQVSQIYHILNLLKMKLKHMYLQSTCDSVLD